MAGRTLSARLLSFGAVLSCLALLMTGGCGGSGASSPSPFLPPPPAKKGKYFTHIVVLIQENRTFDNLFATYPGADGTRYAKTRHGLRRLREANLESGTSPNNGYLFWLHGYDSGKMDGFNDYDDEYVDPVQVQPYWDLAKQYVLADHMFATQASGSFTAHQDLIRGGTQINAGQSLIDFPEPGGAGQAWGCDAHGGTVTTLITASNDYERNQGPFPCLNYNTLRDTLDADGLSWRYYAPAVGGMGGNLWNAFDAIRAVRFGSEWTTNEVNPETRVFTDISRDTLAAVSWVIPDFDNSDHPGGTSDSGPSWVAQVVNAIGESPAWKTTAIVIVWDDWGGWYDHVVPPGARHYGGLGSRVPAIVVSPYAKDGYVSHNLYQFGSVVRFIEENWDLPSLGTTDKTSASFVDDFFDFSQKPRPYQPITAKYSRSFFLHQRPSNKPVDTQ